MTKKTRIIILTSSAIVLLIIAILTVIDQKKRIKKNVVQEINGIITKIDDAGRNSRKITFTTQQGGEDSVFWRGLGHEDGDIIIGDSISKKVNDNINYIYRKTGGKYNLVYKKEFSTVF